MQTPPSNPSAPPTSSRVCAVDLQTDLLRQILKELQGVRELMDRVTEGGNAMVSRLSE